MVEWKWYDQKMQAAYERGETVFVDSSMPAMPAIPDMPAMMDGDQLVHEGFDVKLVRNGEVIWHKPGSKFITAG